MKDRERQGIDYVCKNTHAASLGGEGDGGAVAVANKYSIGPSFPSQSLSIAFQRLYCKPRPGPGQTMQAQESEIHAPAHRCLQS